MDYTPSQRDAISTVDQNLQIIACAGSGKTQVISARIVEILKKKKSENITPGNIVAFTFTEKAAGELKDRIHSLCQSELGTDLGLAEMFVGTIHGYCLNLLQSPPLYKFLKYTVLNDIEQRLLIDRYSKQSGLTETPLLKGGSLQRWKESNLYQQLLNILGEGNVQLEKVPRAVVHAIKKYHALREEKKCLDYTTIIAEAVAELTINQELRKQISSQIKYVVVDEYQDVNPLQETLVQELHILGANLCIVGDDDQTIYQWRGSDVKNIITFTKRYQTVKAVSLNENFRSSIGIVHSARQLVEKNPERLNKRMESTDAQAYQRGDMLALSFDDPTAEAYWVAEKINSLVGIPYSDKIHSTPRGLTFSDFAILLRSVRNDAKPILTALDHAGIPYVVGGVNELFATLEVKAMREAFFYLADFTPREKSPITTTTLKEIFTQARLGLKPEQISAGITFLKERKAELGDKREAKLYLQRLYLDFLERIELREEAITEASDGQRSGEIVYYNLGKLSQVISDFEKIHFQDSPADMYHTFAKFLYYEAPGYYPEGWEDAGQARPDAVQIMTVHKAKGMQWPVVFIPCLRKNRFPSKKHGGRSVWHIIPENCVENVDRYKGSIEDERRLFYVALTRAEKYLFCSWAPIVTNRQQRKISPFLQELTGSQYVLTKDSKVRLPARIAQKPRAGEVTLALTFSELKYYFDCPYLFKLRFLYGFNAPISQALGYGKSIHDALVEVHSESMKHNIPAIKDVPTLIEDHLHLPFAYPDLKEKLKGAAERALSRYLQDHRQNLEKLEHIEKVIELKLEDGIVVNGRIDLGSAIK